MISKAMYTKICKLPLQYFEINTLDELKLDAKNMRKMSSKERGGGILGKVFHCDILDPVV